MERQSNVHSPRVDDELAHEVESLTRGAPVESRVDPARTKEDAADGEPVPQAIVAEPTDPADPVALGHDEVRARSELAIHLLPSRFPMTRAEVIECATEQDAPAELLAALDRLPDGTYANVEQVWEALGGRREERSRREVASREAPTVREPEPSPAPGAAVRRPAPSLTTFEFAFDWCHRIAAVPFGVHPGNAVVQVDERIEPPTFQATFGPWRVTTPLANVAATEITGPYNPITTVGPARVSLTDGGLTFATNAARGLCIRFREPVRGVEPLGVLRHGSLTITVDDPEALQATIERHRDR
jgi:uncharacterized protein DUF2795